MENIIVVAQIFSEKIICEAFKNDRNKYHTRISGKSCVLYVVGSEVNEKERLIIKFLIEEHCSELYGKTVCVHEIKDYNNASAKREPNQSCTDILLCFPTPQLYTVFI